MPRRLPSSSVRDLRETALRLYQERDAFENESSAGADRMRDDVRWSGVADGDLDGLGLLVLEIDLGLLERTDLGGVRPCVEGLRLHHVIGEVTLDADAELVVRRGLTGDLHATDAA